MIGHRLGDVQEMLEELGGDVLIHLVVARQLQRDPHQVEAVHRHPGGTVGLVDVAARRQRCAAVEDPDVVEAEKPALKDVAALGVLAVHPPGEVEHELVEDPLEEGNVPLVAPALAVDLEHPPRRPGVDRRVHVTEGPFVRRKLAVGMHVPLSSEQHELVLRELRVDQRERNAMEGEIPGGVPGILPAVRHRDDISIVQVLPLRVASAPPARRRRRLPRVAGEPLRDVVIEELLAPYHPREGLPLHHPRVGVRKLLLQLAVELVRFAGPELQQPVEVGEQRAGMTRGESHPDRAGAARGDHDLVPRPRLGSLLRRIHRLGATAHDPLVESILGVHRPAGMTEEPGGIGLVLGKEQPRTPLDAPAEVPQRRVGRQHRTALGTELRPDGVRAPRPGIPVPELGDQMQRRRLGAAIVGGDPEQDVVAGCLGVLDDHVEVAVVVEGPGVDQLVLRLTHAPRGVLVEPASRTERRTADTCTAS